MNRLLACRSRMKMRVVSAIVFVGFLATGTALSFAADKSETSHLLFVAEYIRELAAIERIRSSVEQEQRQNQESETFSNSIHACTALQLELRSQIGMLKNMRLNAPFDTLIPTIIGFDQAKVNLYQRMCEIGKAFLAGSKPDVDYGILAAEMPEVRAKLEYADHSLFEVTPLVFATLIDEKPDSKHHASHLMISKAERSRLLDSLADDFGAKLDQKEQNYTIGSASVLKAYLLKDYKCSDDPWE